LFAAAANTDGHARHYRILRLMATGELEGQHRFFAARLGIRLGIAENDK
jgi:hypothetical protein